MVIRPRGQPPTLPPQDAWSPWTPHEIAELLAAVDAPWSFVGGWALDLWHGRQTRKHADIEIAVLRSDFARFRMCFAGLLLCTAKAGRLEPLRPGTLPPRHITQVWVLDARASRWKLDIMLEPGDRETWMFRREPAISRPRAEMTGSTMDGLPYLAPEGVLLYKAKATRPKDQKDFVAALPLLDPQARNWLEIALTRVHPGHRWIDAISRCHAPHGER